MNNCGNCGSECAQGLECNGGVCTPAQWLALDAVADSHANGTLKITNRQAFQLHGILKGNLRPAIREVNRALLDTLAACGDVNRNVMCNPNPHISRMHKETLDVARAVANHLLPRTRAYHELWVDEELVAGGEPEDEEPLYGKTYLPRKFKTVFAIPPSNDVDVFAHDLGFIAIADDKGRLTGFDVTVGGGMGMAHNQVETFPRLADVLGFCRPEQAVAVAEAVVVAGAVHEAVAKEADSHEWGSYSGMRRRLPPIRSLLPSPASAAR